MKICTVCAKEKDESEFWKDSSKKDGLNPWCISCVNSGGVPGDLKRRGIDPPSDRSKILYNIAMQYQRK